MLESEILSMQKAWKSKKYLQKELAEMFGVSVISVRYHTIPKSRDKILEGNRKRRHTPKYRKYFREYYMDRYHSNPKFKVMVLNNSKEYRKKHKNDPEYKGKRAEYAKRYYQKRPEYYKEYRKRYWKELKSDFKRYKRHKLKRRKYQREWLSRRGVSPPQERRALEPPSGRTY